jgi:hypothetical protein
MGTERLSDRHWLTDKAYEYLDGHRPIHVSDDTLRELVDDLVDLDAKGAISLTAWPAAAALVDAAYPVRRVEDAPTGGRT